MKKTLTAIIMFLAVSLQAHAGDIFANLEYYARLGYNLGGTAPIGMPATIRKLNSYTIQPNVTLALDAYKPLGKQWGVVGGFHIERKGMKTDAQVKNYNMSMTRGGETLSGVFTGNVITKVDQWLLSLHLQAACDVSPKVRLRLGPYLSYALSQDFSGDAYDGYLRVDNPTGSKVELGTEEGSRGTYDFSDDLRKLQLGVDAGVDWAFSQRWGAYADLSWGVTGIFKSSFHTIEQTLYPIFGTVGITYKLK